MERMFKGILTGEPTTSLGLAEVTTRYEHVLFDVLDFIVILVWISDVIRGKN